MKIILDFDRRLSILRISQLITRYQLMGQERVYTPYLWKC